MNTQPLQILARLEIIKVRAFWRMALRDPGFDGAVVIGILIGIAALVRLFKAALAQPPALAFCLAFGVGWLLYRQLYPGERSGVRTSLTAGPLHSLVVEPRQMARWLLLRTSVMAAIAALLSAGVLAWVNLQAAGLYLAAMSLGAGVTAGLTYRRETAPARPVRKAGTLKAVRLRGRGTAVSRGTDRPQRRAHPLLVLAWLTLRRRKLGLPAGVWAAALLVIDGLAAALAAHNNDNPALGVSLASIAALGAGLLLLPAGPIVALLGREPSRLGRLYLQLYALPFVVGVLGGVLVTLCAGLGPVLALEVGVSVLAGLALITAFAFLGRLTHSQRLARTSTILEFVAAIILSAIQVSLAPLWLVIRGVILARQAGRMRWLDR